METAKKSAGGLQGILNRGFTFATGGIFGSSGGVIPGLANISQIIQGIPQIGQLAGAIIRPLTDAAEEGIKLNMTLEQAEIGFTAVAGSAEKAHDHLMKLQAFGAASPFRFEGLLAAARLMTAMSFTIDEQIPKLTIWGNAIAASGDLSEERVHNVVVALGQMRMAGRVNAQDMNQLTNALIPGWTLLARAIGKTVAETRKLAENGKLNGKVAVEAITEMMRLDPIYKDAMQKLQGTLGGRISAAQDLLQIAQGTATQGLAGNLSKMLQDALDRPDLVASLSSTINSILSPVSALIETGVKQVLAPGITTGIVDGLRLGKNMVKDALIDFAEDSIIGSIKGALGINSPSKVFTELGYNSAEGYRDGILLGLRGMTPEMLKGFDDLFDDIDGLMQSRTRQMLTTQQRSKAALDKLLAKEPGFLEKLKAGAKARGINPDHLLNVMAIETAGTFDPKITNPYGYTGLIQFGKSAAKDLGTSTSALRAMSATDQLDYVFRYLDQHLKNLIGKVEITQAQLYSAVGAGSATRDDQAVKFRAGSEGYRLNQKSWDVNQDKMIQQWEFGVAAMKKLGAGELFTVNGAPVTGANPVPVYLANVVGGAGGMSSDGRIGGWRTPPRRGSRQVTDNYSTNLPPIDTSGTVIGEAEMLSTSMSFDPSKLVLQLRPLTPMIVASAEAAAKLALEMANAAKAAESPALGPGQWYEAATAMGSMQQRLSEMFDALPENKRFMEDIFISIPSRFGDVMGDAVMQADGTLKGFWSEVGKDATNMFRQIVAEMMRQLVTRSMTKLFQRMLGTPEFDKDTGEATGRNVGGWGFLSKIGGFVGKLFGGGSKKSSTSTTPTGPYEGDNLPKRAFGGPVFAGKPVIVGDHPFRRPNPEIFIPKVDGQITPVNQYQAQGRGGYGFGAGGNEMPMRTDIVLVDDERQAREHYNSSDRAYVRKVRRTRKLQIRR